MFSKADIEKYFIAEKETGLLFLVIGLIAIIAAILLFFFMIPSFYHGVAVVFATMGLLLGTVGFTVYKRSDNDRLRNVYAYDMNPSELKEKELPRMEAVMKKFIIYRYVSLFVLVLGAFMYVYFIRDIKNDFWRGVGITLAIVALLVTVTDYFAEKRARKYITGIKQFVQIN